MHSTCRRHRWKLVVGLVVLLMALTALPASAWDEPGVPPPTPMHDAHPDPDADPDADPLAGLALPDLATDPGSELGDLASGGRAPGPALAPGAPAAAGGPPPKPCPLPSPIRECSMGWRSTRA
ncbi:hypothetical protein ACFRJ3_20685 [Streptomyces sp. NPDC056696]|uniref:hypothetical protein n=1 Tax=Streptomyces sp. NPDC056696 TaxID=3345914 RepID=UPI0036A9DB0F